VKECMVELPLVRKQRLMAEYKLPEGDADMFVADSELADYFEEAAQREKNPKAVANWIINDLQAKLTEGETSLAGLKFTQINQLSGKPFMATELVEKRSLSLRWFLIHQASRLFLRFH